MKALTLLASLMLTAAVSAAAAEKDPSIYVLSTITAKPGKLDAIHALLKDRLIPQVAKVGVTNLAILVPIENAGERIFTLSSIPSPDTAEKLKAAMQDGGDLKATITEIGTLADETKREPRRVMTATDFSPAVKAEAGKTPRVFELRTYTTTPGNLPLLHARFRDHTTALFTKHGMTNLWYWQLLPEQPGADNTLIYLLSHASPDAAKASFDAFRADPDWIAAKTASEEKGGGSLTVPDGVKSVFLKATDYSPLR